MISTLEPIPSRAHVTRRAAAAPASPDTDPGDVLSAGVAFLTTRALASDQRAADSSSVPVGPLVRACARDQRADSSLPLVRACACCELEHGLLNRRDNTKTHGHCRRHFHALLVEAGLSVAVAWLETDRLAPSAFCPDLGPVLKAT